MKKSTLFLIGIFLASIVALASFAFAQCSSCMKEGDWTQTASNFISGTPTSDVPAEFGPKAVRKTESQFENTDSVLPPQTGELILRSINVTPALANIAGTVKITAVFAQNGSLQAENQTEIQLTATASIKDSSGKEVEKLSLIKTSGNGYSKDWNVNVPAGIYSVDIAASSLQGAGNFSDALQIEVVGSGNATGTEPAA